MRVRLIAPAAGPVGAASDPRGVLLNFLVDLESHGYAKLHKVMGPWGSHAIGIVRIAAAVPYVARPGGAQPTSCWNMVSSPTSPQRLAAYIGLTLSSSAGGLCYVMSVPEPGLLQAATVPHVGASWAMRGRVADAALWPTER